MSVRSLRELAEKLNLSHATVSSALRGSPLVKESTRLRVLEAAEQLGYRGNPLASALMAEMRRSRGSVFRGLLAILDLDPPGRRTAGASSGYHAELAAGAAQRAQELGFKTDAITAGAPGYELTRLNEVFFARGIRGVFILPSLDRPDLSCLDWSRLSGLYADYVIGKPRLNAICPDHHRAMILALDELHALGYRSPGLVIDPAIDARLMHRWQAAYHAYFSDSARTRPAAPLLAPRLDEAGFAAWFTAGGFDVVLGHDPAIPDWMRAAGASIPETHGFCCLNLVRPAQPCAGLDLQPRTIGRRGMDLLAGQVMRNEFGPADPPLCSLVPANWMHGPSVRAQTDPVVTGQLLLGV